MLQIQSYEGNSEMIEFCNRKNFDKNYSERIVEVYPLSFSLIHYETDLVKSKIFS